MVLVFQVTIMNIQLYYNKKMESKGGLTQIVNIPRNFLRSGG